MISFICRTSEKVGAGILVDVDKLRKKIAENKLNIASIANRIGIDRATFYRNLSGKGMNFTIREADMIAKELGLDKDEAVCIFFGQIVADMRNPTKERR